MRKSLVLTAIFLVTSMGGAAMARDDEQSCMRARQTETVSIDAMKQRIDNLGYEVRRIEAEHGCFEAYIIDRRSGGGVKATFSRADGELLRAKLAS